MSVQVGPEYATFDEFLNAIEFLNVVDSPLCLASLVIALSPTSRQLGICLLIALITINLQYSRKSLQVIDGTAATAAILVIIQHDIFQVILSSRVSA